jgi:hypothetical protein
LVLAKKAALSYGTLPDAKEHAQGADIHRPTLSGALARMQQHVFDDRIRALAMLHGLVEVALQRVRDIADLRSQLGD